MSAEGTYPANVPHTLQTVRAAAQAELDRAGRAWRAKQDLPVQPTVPAPSQSRSTCPSSRASLGLVGCSGRTALRRTTRTERWCAAL